MGLKKKIFLDEEADWVQSKETVVTMKKEEDLVHDAKRKTPVVTEKAPERTRDLPFAFAGTSIADREGLERACEQGDAYTYGDNE